jgi:hypothetical protein
MIALLALASGCGPGTPKKMTLEGTATYKGEPLNNCILTFVGPTNELAIATVRDDGKFTVTDMLPGVQKVGVVSRPVNSSGSSGGGPTQKARPPVQIPAKLNDPATSGATVDVTESTKSVTVEFK